jgi:hypothetical protein
VGQGDLDGLAGADAICTQSAANAGLSGNWTAWLSDDTEDARDRIPAGIYQLLDGTVVANSLFDLTHGVLKAPINLDENGDPLGGFVWTGTQPDGTGTSQNCIGWTVATSPVDCNLQVGPECATCQLCPVSRRMGRSIYILTEPGTAGKY